MSESGSKDLRIATDALLREILRKTTEYESYCRNVLMPKMLAEGVDPNSHDYLRAQAAAEAFAALQHTAVCELAYRRGPIVKGRDWRMARRGERP